MKKHTEARLEDTIVEHLTTQGGYVFVDYRTGAAKDLYEVCNDNYSSLRKRIIVVDQL